MSKILKKIFYKKINYKYELMKDFCFATNIKISYSSQEFSTTFCYIKYNKKVFLQEDGLLIIKKGFCWDGPSGPTIDTDTFMVGAIIHDALYYLIREKILSIIPYRKKADQLLREICIKEGMSKFRANYVYYAVRIFGKFSVIKNA